MNTLYIKYFKREKHQQGAAMVVIIIAMIVVATLGLGIYALTSTAMFNQVVAQQATRAFYLSESGLRIAFGQYNAAQNKNESLVKLHNTSYTMPDGSIGKIALEIYPYWFYSTAAATAGTTPLTLYIPGAIPTLDDSDTPITLPSSGYLRIRDWDRCQTWPDAPTVAHYTAAQVGSFDSTKGTPVTFTLDTTFSADLCNGDDFFLGSTGFSIYQSPTETDPTLILNYSDLNAAQFFPLQKGVFFVDKFGGGQLSPPCYFYDLRVIDTSNNRVKFINVQPVTADQSPKYLYIENVDGSDPLTATDYIFVYKVISAASTGTFGE